LYSAAVGKKNLINIKPTKTLLGSCRNELHRRIYTLHSWCY